MSIVTSFFHSLANNSTETEKIVVHKRSILVTEHEEATHTFTDGTASASDMVHFVRTRSVPLVDHRTKGNPANTGVPVIVVYFKVDFGYHYGKDTTYVRLVGSPYKIKIIPLLTCGSFPPTGTSSPRSPKITLTPKSSLPSAIQLSSPRSCPHSGSASRRMTCQSPVSQREDASTSCPRCKTGRPSPQIRCGGSSETWWAEEWSRS